MVGDFNTEFKNAYELNRRLEESINLAENDKEQAAKNFLAILSSFGDTPKKSEIT